MEDLRSEMVLGGVSSSGEPNVVGFFASQLNFGGALLTEELHESI